MKQILLCVIAALAFAANGNLVAQYSSINQVFSINGAGYLSVPFSDDLNQSITSAGVISIDAWVYPTRMISYMTIVGNDYTTGYWLGITPSGKIRFYPHGMTYYESAGSISIDQWSHVGVSYDAGKNSMRFYINGSLSSSVTTIQGYIGYSYNDLRIGADRQSGSPTYHWYGYIDEVRMWKGVVDFSSAVGMLFKIPHQVVNGRYGRYLIAAWRLNGDGLDEAGGHHGSLVGKGDYLTNPVPSHYARICAVFSNFISVTGGSIHDMFMIPHSSSISLTQNYTLECWIRPASTSGDPSYQTFLTKGFVVGLPGTYWLGLNKSTGKVRFVPHGNFSGGFESNVAIPLNQWTHVAARFLTIGGTRIATIFINGLPAGSQNYLTNASPNQNALVIGRTEFPDIQYGGYGFAGKIDEVRVWREARTDDQIADNYRLELDGRITNLAAVYHFDGDIHDRSGNGNNGYNTVPTTSDLYFNDANDLPSFPSITVYTPNGSESWEIGSSRAIKWSSNGLYNVRIELSRDGGSNYPEVLTTSTSASSGSFTWSVTAPATNQARMRVTTPSPTSVEDASDNNFIIREPSPVLSVAPMTLVFTTSENGPLPPPQKIYIKNIGGGLLSWTASNTESWLNCAPVSRTSNDDSVTVSILTSALSEGSYSDEITIGGNASNAGLKIKVIYRITTKRIYSVSGFVLEGNMGVPGISITILGDINTNVTTGRDGSYEAHGLPEGDYLVMPSSLYYEFTPLTYSFEPLDSNRTGVNFSAVKKTGSALIQYKEGWNLISLPLVPDTNDLKMNFPHALPPAYLYLPDSGYIPTQILNFGTGYWIKFSKTDSVIVHGILQGTLTTTLESGYGGWNLIGTPSGNVLLDHIEQTPDSAIIVAYGYDPIFGYVHPPGGLLQSGKSYFIKSAVHATIRMVSSAFVPPEPWQDILRLPGAQIIEGQNLPPPPPVK